MKIVLATRNADKVREIEAMLQSLDVDVIGLDRFDNVPEVVEDGETLHDNALKKAREIREATGLSALSDDTGLEVAALDGAPGVLSSRYAGEDATYEDNCRKLLDAMTGVATRGARFRCVMALAISAEDAARVKRRPTEEGIDDTMVIEEERAAIDAFVTEGIVAGLITTESRGSSGFGYDPIFEVATLGKTLAEIGLEEKNRISHRYRALVEMREMLLRHGLANEVCE